MVAAPKALQRSWVLLPGFAEAGGAASGIAGGKSLCQGGHLIIAVPLKGYDMKVKT
jgi:hypothetical protein